LALLDKFVYEYRGNNTYVTQEKTVLGKKHAFFCPNKLSVIRTFNNDIFVVQKWVDMEAK
jgi:hypothetical protein